MRANGIGPASSVGSAEDLAIAAPGLPLTFDRSFETTITGRSTLGPQGAAGSGQAAGCGCSRTEKSDGSVEIIDDDGTVRTFVPDERGGYFSTQGDHATLTFAPDVNDSFLLHETDGSVTAFRADGKVHYVEDTNGNRITAGYTGGRITSLNHSSGQILQIVYNDAGRIGSVSDPASGRRATFNYDPSGQHLMSVQGFDGRTTVYPYGRDQCPERSRCDHLDSSP